MVRLKELRKNAATELEMLGSDSPVADVDYVLTHMLGFKKSDIVLGDKVIDETSEKVFEEAMKRLKQGEPVQYVAGGCEFMSLWFGLNSSTLIPRADTEILVEAIVQRLKDVDSAEILEIGTGSGCIAVSLAHYLKQAKVKAIDVSKGALEIARENARRLGVSDRCSFLEWDIMRGFPEFESQPTVVVSNPPYIPNQDIAGLEKKVKDFEPLSALDGGMDGLDFYRQIVKEIRLAPCGLLAFEVGINQAKSVAELMKDRFCRVEVLRDLNGISRVVLGYQREN